MDIFALILNFVIFLIAILICFYIPGRVLIKKLKFSLSRLESVVYSFGLGFISFTFLSYIFDTFHLFIFIYPSLVIFLALFLREKLWKVSFTNTKEKYAIGIIIALSIFFTFPLQLSGVYGNGVHLVNINASDSMFHIAMINEMQHHFPPDHPGFANAKLTGYHIFSDYVWAKLLLLFPMDKMLFFFHDESLFTALMWGLGVYIFMKRWMKSTVVALCAVFFTQYGGSFVWIIHLYGHTKVSLDSGFGMLQAFVSLINPPYSISVVVILFGLFSFLSYLQTKQKTWIVPLILFFGLAAEFKVYAGILIFGGFGIFIFLTFIQDILTFFKKHTITSFSPTLQYSGVFVGIIVLFAITYMRLSGKGGFLIYFPYWAPIDVVRSNLSFMNYDNQMYVYGQFGMLHRIVWLQIRIFLLFLFGNLGSRTLGWICFVFYPKKKSLFSSSFTWMLITMLLLAFFIPLFFIQSIKPFEISQMWDYFLFFAALFAAIGLGKVFISRLSKVMKIILAIIIIAITIPSMTATVLDYLPAQQPTLTKEQYAGMQLLQKDSNYNNTLLVLPELHDPNSFEDPDSWIHPTNTMYPALTNKRSFFSDENITYPDDMQKRVDFLAQIETLEDKQLAQSGDTGLQNSIKEKLKSNHIKYVYSLYKLPVVKNINLQRIYATKGAYIYKVL